MRYRINVFVRSSVIVYVAANFEESEVVVSYNPLLNQYPKLGKCSRVFSFQFEHGQFL